MQKRAFLWGCIVIALLVLVFLAIGGWWFFRSTSTSSEASPGSPVQVFLLSPTDGAEVTLGDYILVSVQAFSTKTIRKTEFFVDGNLLNTVTDAPQNASWTWQALTTGIHTLHVRATDADGNLGQSQTVILNVLAGNGVIQVPAQEGQTLQQIGENFGVPPDQMAGANPHVDANQPLKDGQPVHVPLPSGDSEPGSGQPQPPIDNAADSPPLISIIWTIKFNDPVDQSYCYTSVGNDQWEKIPKDPFTFFQGLDNLYTQLIPAADQVVLQVDCWGWLGGVLKYLGQGKTSFDIKQAPAQVLISGPGFEFAGIPQIPGAYGGGPTQTVPPPYAMREPKDTGDCQAHGNLDCNSLLNAQVKQYIVLEWEWAKPGLCWPGYCDFVDTIDGYRLYEVDPFSKAETLLHVIEDPNQKEAALPLPWGPKCYGVRAYTKSPAYLESDIATYCPGDPPQPQKITFYPTAWVTTGGQWVDSGDCSSFGGVEPYLFANQESGFGSQAGEVMVGEYIVDDSGCFEQGDYAGGVKFSPSLPPGGIVQKAVLRFSTISMDFGSPGWASPTPSSCVATVSQAIADWSSYSSGSHYTNSIYLSSSKLSTPITAVSPFSSPQADITPAVENWILHPESNFGFALPGASALSPLDDGYGRCLSSLGNFLLDVYYLAP